jgi:amidophosphoribosyltransferase
MGLSTAWERPGEECGVFGVYAPGMDVARLTYFGLFALQHRGQESAGIAASDGQSITVRKDLGLVSQVFDQWALASLQGDLALGHNRYSTTGSTSWENAQPTYRGVDTTGFALAHNGNLTNTAELAQRLGRQTATTDTELMAEGIARAYSDAGGKGGIVGAIEAALPTFAGAFSLVIVDEQRLIGIRDRHGFRPLSLGRIDGGWVLASETCALDVVAAEFEREVEPGEMVVIDGGGVESRRPLKEPDPHLCILEFVYFSRPDSYLCGRNVHQARLRMGELLAGQSPVLADVIVPVPESGVPAAQGYAKASGIPYEDAFVKNRYVGRTFIQPAQVMRDQGIRMKLNPIPEVIGGQRVLIVDDSIIRGSTTRNLVEMVRATGAAEVHLRIASPPYRWPCFYGMDTPERAQLIAAARSVEEVAEFLGVDSLAYLSLENLIEATGAGALGLCTACLSGDYPTAVPFDGDKYLLERSPS